MTVPAARISATILPLAGAAHNPFDLKRVGGGLLVQTPDDANVRESDLRVVTKRAPKADEIRDLMFVWRVAKFVKSNAIVYGHDGRTLGIGAGQMSRVDSTKIAALKAAAAGLSLRGSAVASDAFFPFRDGLASTGPATFQNVNVPADTPVFFEVAGVNPRVQLVRTDANGQASFSYTALGPGKDTIVAWATVNNSALTSNKLDRHDRNETRIRSLSPHPGVIVCPRGQQ